MRITCLAILTTSYIALSSPQRINFICDSKDTTHALRVELTRDTETKQCSAIAIDTGYFEGSFNFNNDFNCTTKLLAKDKTYQQELIEMKSIGVKGIGSESGRYESVRLILETNTKVGAGMGVTKLNLLKVIHCVADDELIRPEL